MPYISAIYLRSENNADVLYVFLSGRYKTEFATELTYNSSYQCRSEFAVELIALIKAKYPEVQKATVKIITGAIVLGLVQITIPAYPQLIAQEVYSAVLPAEQTYKFNMTYLYFGSPASQLASLTENKEALDVVAPSYFDITQDGELILSALFNEDFIKAAKTTEVSIVPFLSNHWDREAGRAALSNREKLSQDIANIVEAYGLDGVNIDLENLTEKDRDAYTDFVRLLRTKIPLYKEVSVAVAANPKSWSNGWQGSYDYEALSEHADYLMIMAYDESWQNGSPGPVASIGFVEQSIQYALRFVEPDKIMVGIPFYGRYWKDNEAAGGYGISMSQVESLISKYPSRLSFDEEKKSPVVNITISEGDVKPVIGGRTWDIGTYTIWYENPKSIKEKLLLINEYNLRGSASWSMGQEGSGIWDNTRLWLGGCPFEDVGNSWAKEDIATAYSLEYIRGTSSDTFEPQRPVTRAEAVTMMVRATKRSSNTMPSFVDTQGHWAQEYIAAAVENHIVTGRSDLIFDPDATLSRAEAAQMIANLLKDSEPGTEPISFSDSKAHWAAAAIEKAAAAGILKGFPDGSFRPDEKVTREQIAAMILRLMQEVDK